MTEKFGPSAVIKGVDFVAAARLRESGPPELLGASGRHVGYAHKIHEPSTGRSIQ